MSNNTLDKDQKINPERNNQENEKVIEQEPVVSDISEKEESPITPENTPVVNTPTTEGRETTLETTNIIPETTHDGTNTPTNEISNLPEKVRILKEAFPETDVDIIEAILQATDDNVERAFETLLGMSDPNYHQSEEQTPPPMPPRPTQRQISVDEQLRLDEEFAKKLAMDDELRAERRRSSSQQQRHNRQEEEDDPFAKFQEELPIIKEKMKEAGNAAKKKVMDLYNQFKANTQKSTNQNQYDHLPTTNAQYRGLPSDDGDDLLTGDNTALHLSDYDVYAKTNGRQQLSNEYTRDNDTIYVNPPSSTPISKVQTSTSDAQLKADEDFARRLVEEEQLEARRSRHTSATEDSLQQRTVPPQMPPRKNVVIAPRSPLEFEGDSDYEDVGLTASTTKNNDTSQNESVPYVIGDDDDSDSDLDLKDLVDDDEQSNTTDEKKDDIKNATTSSLDKAKESEKPNTH